MEWFETSENPPIAFKVVLGFWSAVCLETVILHANGRWTLPGYIRSEFREPPEYWGEVPNLPPGYIRGE